MIYSRKREKTEALSNAGAQVTESTRQLAECGDTVVMSWGSGTPDFAAVQKGIEAMSDRGPA